MLPEQNQGACPDSFPSSLPGSSRLLLRDTWRWTSVSHDGGKATGDHCYTLTVTDRCSGWTEIAPVPSRAQVFVFAALTTVLNHLPFPVLVLHLDNGSEFINNELRWFCDAHGIRFTRSRPYHKNDNCYVESKNWTLVRRCLGYRRFEGESQLADLRQMETLLARRANILQPSMALQEKVRTGKHPSGAPLTLD